MQFLLLTMVAISAYLVIRRERVGAMHIHIPYWMGSRRATNWASDLASINWQWAMLGGKERKPLLDWDDTFGHEKARVKAMSMCFSQQQTHSKLVFFFPGFIITIDSIDLR